MLQVSEVEVTTRLRFDNPWWESGAIEKRFSDLPHRLYFPPFFELVMEETVNRAIILMGPRRVGKTVLAYHAIHALIQKGVDPRKILFVSLETPIYIGLPLEKLLNLFLKEFSYKRDENLYIFFDEIQYFKNWEVHLKSLVDSYPAHKYVATGSAAAALKLKSRESGAGRFTEFVLPPLSFCEYLRFIDKEDALITKHASEEGGTSEYEVKDIDLLNAEFINYLNYGGYPEAVFSEVIQSDSARYIKSDIIDKVLLRDLPSLYGIHDVQELNRLFTTLAYNTGNEVGLEELSKGSGIAKNTIKRYLEYLEAAFLIKTLTRIDQTAKKLKRAVCFKVYLTNPSMRAALFGPIDEASPAMGNLTETAIYSQWFHSSAIDNLYYARWKGGEVDLVYLDTKTYGADWGVEVKWSDLPVVDHRKIKGLITFLKLHNIEDGMVTTKTLNVTKMVDGMKVDFIPSALYAYMLSANILRDPEEIVLRAKLRNKGTERTIDPDDPLFDS